MLAIYCALPFLENHRRRRAKSSGELFPTSDFQYRVSRSSNSRRSIRRRHGFARLINHALHNERTSRGRSKALNGLKHDAIAMKRRIDGKYPPMSRESVRFPERISRRITRIFIEKQTNVSRYVGLHASTASIRNKQITKRIDKLDRYTDD